MILTHLVTSHFFYKLSVKLNMEPKQKVSIVNAVAGNKVPKRTSKRNAKVTEKMKDNLAAQQAKKLRTNATNRTMLSSDVVVVTPKRNLSNKP